MVTSVVSGSEGLSQAVCLQMVWTTMISRGEESVLQQALGWQVWATAEIQDGTINTFKTQDTVTIIIEKNNRYTLRVQPCVIIQFKFYQVRFPYWSICRSTAVAQCSSQSDLYGE